MGALLRTCDGVCQPWTKGAGKGCERTGLTSDRKSVIDPSDNKQTTVVDCGFLEMLGEAPGDGGLGVLGRAVLTGWWADVGLTSPRLRPWKDLGSELEGTVITASSSVPLPCSAGTGAAPGTRTPGTHCTPQSGRKPVPAEAKDPWHR